jgi:glycosyl transferase family 87
MAWPPVRPAGRGKRMAQFADCLSVIYRRLVARVVASLTPGRRRFYPRAILACSILAWAGNSIARPGLDGTPRHLLIGGDFLAAYMGGRFLLEHRVSELYEPTAQIAFMQQITGSSTTRLPPFVYPPYNTLFYALFSTGPYWLGLVLWLGTGLSAVAWAAHAFRRDLLGPASPSTARLVRAAFLFYPTLAWLLYGQHTGFALFAYVLWYLCLRRGRDVRAGLVLGLLALKPQLLIGPCVLLLVEGRWRTLTALSVALGVCFAAAWVISPSAIGAFVRFGPQLMAVQEARIWGEQTLLFFARLLFRDVSSVAANAVGIALMGFGAALLVSWWWGKPWEPNTRAWDLRMAASLALGILIAPHLYWYDLMLLLLPIAIAWSHYRRPGPGVDSLFDGGPMLAWTSALFLVAWLGSYVTLAQLRLTAWLGLPAMAIQVTVPVVAIWALAVRQSADAMPGSRAA